MITLNVSWLHPSIKIHEVDYKKKGRIKRENNKALAYATYEIPTLAFMDRLLQAEELKIFCVSGKQKGAGLTTLISHKAEDK